MPATNQSAFLVWSLTGSGLGTTISASGNSGTWATATPNARTPVDTRWADDLWLSVNATSGAGTNLKVQVNWYDDQGNLFQFSSGTTPLLGVTVASAPGNAIAFAGRHGGASGNFLVASEWAQVAWTITGSMTGVEIALYAR
jgi:hypothetical protein